VNGYFDANGNQIRLSSLQGVTWNYRNNLGNVITVARQGSPSDGEYYVYDSTGSRVRKVAEQYANGGTAVRIEETIYLGSLEIKRISQGSNVVEERHSLRVMDDTRAIATRIAWTQGNPPDGVKSPQMRYQLDNLLGSATLEVDADGQIISYEEYFPYGGTAVIAGRSASEVQLKQYRYSGKERDSVTGFYYYGFRYYAPWLGRWMSPDPAGTVDGLNLYAFVGGNPSSWVDGDGRTRFGSLGSKSTTHSRKEITVRKNYVGNSTKKSLFSFSRNISTKEFFKPLQAIRPNVFKGFFNSFRAIKQETFASFFKPFFTPTPRLGNAQKASSSQAEKRKPQAIHSLEEAINAGFVQLNENGKVVSGGDFLFRGVKDPEHANVTQTGSAYRHLSEKEKEAIPEGSFIGELARALQHSVGKADEEAVSTSFSLGVASDYATEKGAVLVIKPPAVAYSYRELYAEKARKEGRGLDLDEYPFKGQIDPDRILAILSPRTIKEIYERKPKLGTEKSALVRHADLIGRGPRFF
jgi:RHS repeat-associated protein